MCDCGDDSSVCMYGYSTTAEYRIYAVQSDQCQCQCAPKSTKNSGEPSQNVPSCSTKLSVAAWAGERGAARGRSGPESQVEVDSGAKMEWA